MENGSSPTQNNLSPVSIGPKKLYTEFEGKPDDPSDRRYVRSPENIRQTSVSEDLFGKDRRANQRLSEIDDEYMVDIDEDAKFKTLPTTTHEQSPKLSKFSEYSTIKVSTYLIVKRFHSVIPLPNYNYPSYLWISFCT